MQDVGLVFDRTIVDHTWKPHDRTAKAYVERTFITNIPSDLRNDRANLRGWIKRQHGYLCKGELSAEKTNKDEGTWHSTESI